jgi:hypothetical protein
MHPFLKSEPDSENFTQINLPQIPTLQVLNASFMRGYGAEALVGGHIGVVEGWMEGGWRVVGGLGLGLGFGLGLGG